MASDFEISVMNSLGRIESIATQAKTSAEEAAKASLAASEALNDRLFNSGSGVVTTIQRDITEIKDARKTEAKWDRIHNWAHYSMGPILITLHQIARKLGITI